MTAIREYRIKKGISQAQLGVEAKAEWCPAESQT